MRQGLSTEVRKTGERVRSEVLARVSGGKSRVWLDVRPSSECPTSSKPVWPGVASVYTHLSRCPNDRTHCVTPGFGA